MSARQISLDTGSTGAPAATAGSGVASAITSTTRADTTLSARSKSRSQRTHSMSLRSQNTANTIGSVQTEVIPDKLLAMAEKIAMLVADYNDKTAEKLASLREESNESTELNEVPLTLAPAILSEKGELFDVHGNANGHFEVAWDWRAGNVPHFNIDLWPKLDTWICVPTCSSGLQQRLPADRLIIDLSRVIEDQQISHTLIQHVRSILSWVMRWGPPPHE